LRTVNQHFSELKIEQAPVKTFIGKISRGLFQASCLTPCGPAKAVQNGSRQFCGFFGYHFDGKQLTMATKTVEKHVVHYR
jgi:hypothetical protein